MTLIITMLLLTFGLNPTTGKMNFPKKQRPLPPKPIDYRSVESKKRKSLGFYDNYNDANVNTIVTSDTTNPVNSIKNTISSAENDVSSGMNSISNDVSSGINSVSNDVSSGMNDIKNLF